MSTPPAAVRLQAQLQAHGWTVALTPGAGTVGITRLGPDRPDGTRPRLVVDTPCRSVAVRARHEDGRALRVVYETHTLTRVKRVPAWKCVMAWRGRHDDEHGPQPLTEDEVTAYITQAHDVGLYGLEEAA